MVDFNNNNVVGRAPTDLNKIIRLEKRYNLLEVLETYWKFELQDGQGDNIIPIVRARAMTLYLESLGEIQRGLKDHAEARRIIVNGTTAELFGVIDKLLLLLDEIGLTKIDTAPKIDFTNIEEENAYHGLD